MKKTIGIIVIIAIVITASYFINDNNQNNSNKEANKNITETDFTNDQESEKDVNNKLGEEDVDIMRISVSDGTNNITFELNESEAARSLYEQLPLTIEVGNFSSNEKIFYPTNELNIDNTPRASGGEAGVLAYYAPWKDVVMFYDSFSSASGLYELGRVIESVNQIGNLSGEITIEKLEN